MELTDKKISFVLMFLIFRNKYVFCFLFSFALLTSAFSQQQHFIYFQHEESLPFYLKYEGQIFRSSSTGYLILSKLVRGKQQIFIGLNDSNQQLLRFIWDSLSSDRGYLVKNFGELGWGLFDLQTSEVKYSKNKEEGVYQVSNKHAKDSVANDDFGNMLAKVTQDSSVKYVALVNAEKKVETNAKLKKSSITEIESRVTDNTRELRFLIKENKSNDTVSVFFVEKNVLADNASVNKSVLHAKSESIHADTVGQVKDAVNSELSASALAKEDSLSGREKIKSAKGNCNTIADEEQFVKLRMKMAGQYTEEKMIEEALEAFKQTCFTTVQLRRLSLLLSTDEMKYKFFETSLKFISDANQFPSLRNELQDDIYRKRFDALNANP